MTAQGVTRSLGRRAAAAVLALAGMAAVTAQPAGAIERIQDGNFEQAACSTTDCVSLPWAETATSSGNPIGPICNAVTYFCIQSGSGYSTAPNWTRLGAGFSNNTLSSASHSSSIRQTVQIPAAPARLSFALRMPPIFDTSTGTFTVRVGTTTVFFATTSTTGYSTYQPVVIDVSQFAGGTRDISFEATTQTPPYDNRGAKVRSFDVDNVSVDAPDPVPAAAPTTDAGGAPAASLPAPAAPPVTLAQLQATMKADLDRALRALELEAIANRVQMQLDALRRGDFSAFMTGSPQGAGVARKVVLAKGSRTVSVPGRQTLVLKPTNLGKRLLRHDRRAKVTLTLTFKDADGGTITVHKSVTLRRRR